MASWLQEQSPGLELILHREEARFYRHLGTREGWEEFVAWLREARQTGEVCIPLNRNEIDWQQSVQDASGGDLGAS